jgi:endo-1,4-beta-D-glucanase Y
MIKRFQILLLTATIAVSSAMAAPQYPFPQNRANPYGNTVKYATPQMIQDHFEKWKSAWYQDKGSEAWILAPDGTCSTVSEAIAYGMLIMVYMSSNQKDYKSEFDKLWATWKNNSMGGNGGMNWRIGCDGGSGSATDADVDAALALIMASKQWNDNKYLEAAKSLISWMATNDIDGNNSVKPGSNWNDYFNPSYGTLANFELFAKVSGDNKWNSVKTKAGQDLLACQNSKTGLVTDWCDWNSHQPTKNSKAAVGQDDNPGFFDDAARTPWRMAWAHYWYNNSDAKTFNTKILPWMYNETKGTASNINSGYYPDGTISSKREKFVSSTFSGGLGLAAVSDETETGKNFIATVYKTLSNMTSCATSSGCGSSIPGEKYYPATLNILYLLLMTGNMPNLYDLNGFTQFTPDPSLAPSVSEIDGQQMEKGDTTVGVSGFWNWGAYHDKFNIGTIMIPDSGTSPLYLKNGAIYAEASMEIGPEPEWTQEAADAGTLKYPTAGIAMSFLKSEEGVNLTALGITKVRVNAKIEGPIRFALLNTATVELGGEPGMYLSPSPDYKDYLIDLTPVGKGTKDLEILSWVNENTAPEGSVILTVAKGVKFELKDAKGGIGSFSIKSIEFLKNDGSVVDPALITGITIPEPVSTPIASMNIAKFQTSVNGTQLQIFNAVSGSNFAVFNMQGKVITKGKIDGSVQNVNMPNKGLFMVRVGSETRMISIK